MAERYHGDNQEPGDGNTLIISRDGGGDFLVGVEHRSGGINHGTHFVRFRRANGGASQHPRVIKALAELEAALAEASDNVQVQGLAATSLNKGEKS